LGRKYSRQCGLKVKDFASVVLPSRAVVGRGRKQEPSLTVHQIVAYNFRRAREEEGWTQTQTSEMLQPCLGYRLNQAGVSAIERTFDSDRRRNIDVAEVVAFARCFQRPVGWFFLPPPRYGEHLIEPASHDANSRYNETTLELIYHVLGRPQGWRSLLGRIDELIVTDGPAAREAVEIAIQDRAKEFETQINLRRSTLQQVMLADLMNPGDRAVQKLAESLIELIKLTPEGFRLLRSTNRDAALKLLAEGDRLVKPFVADAARKRTEGVPSQGGYDDLIDIDLEEALGPDEEE
jgi:transcriptional regulator with XRE-family HTH domain